VKKAKGVAGKRLKTFFSKLFRIAAWVAGGVVVFMVVLIGLIRLPSVQNRLVHFATDYLHDRIGTPVSIGRISVSFPKRIEVDDFYLEDQQGDTLMYAQHFEVNTRLVALLRRKIAVQDIRLETAKVYIVRQRDDTAFNYSYIVEAFTEGEDSVKIEEDDAKAWAISLDNVYLGNLYLAYRDRHEDNEFVGRIGEMDVRARETNLADNIYRLRKITLKDTDVSIAMLGNARDDTQDELPTNDSTSIPYTTGLDELTLENVSLRYETPSQHAMVQLGLLDVDVREFDLTEGIAKLSSFALENTRASYFVDKTTPPIRQLETEDSSRFEISPWVVSVDKISLAGNTIQYYDLSDTVRRNGFNTSRIWISSLAAEASDIKADRVTAKATLEKLSFKERSGLAVRNMEGAVALTDNRIDIKGLHTAVNRSDLRLDAHAEFSSIEMLIKEPGKTRFNLAIGPSNVFASDLLLMSPSALDSLPFEVMPGDRMSFSGKADGQVDDLHIGNISIEALDSTRIQMTGNIRGLPTLESTMFDVRLDEFRTTRPDLRRVAGSSLPKDFVVPQWMKLEGAVSGTYRTPRVDAKLTSSEGKISAKGNVDLRGAGEYDLSVEASELQLGHLLADEDLGPASMKAIVKGSGTSVDSMDARVNMLVSGLSYKGYDYKEVRLDGRVSRQLFSGAVVMDDENLDFSLKADLNYGNDIPTYVFTLDMRNIDFKALQLTERPLRARATLDVDLATADFKVMNGRVDLRKVAVFNGTKLYAIDSLLVASIDQVGESSIEIRSDIMTGDFKGSINIFALPAALQQHIGSYFSLSDSAATPPSLQVFEFDLVLKNTDLLTEVLLPPLEPFTPGKVHGTFNSEERTLDMEVSLTDLAYDGITIDSVSVVMDSDPDILNLKLGLKQLRLDTLNIHDLAFTATAANDSMRTALTVLDSLQKEMYMVGARLWHGADNLQLSLIPGEVILNASEWDTPEANLLSFGQGGMHAEQFSISRANQEVALKTNARDSLITIDFKDLELGNITRIVSGAVPASGEMNGEFRFSSSNSGQFSSRLDITGLTVLHKTWGDFNLTVEHANEQYKYAVNLRGNQTRVKASGDYAVVNDSSVVTLAADIQSLNLELIEPFTGGQARKMQGLVEGQLNIYGTLPAIDIRGDIHLLDATFEAVYLNSAFSLEDETISFHKEGIVLDALDIRDALGNAATITGTVKTRQYRDFELELDITAQNFQVLNTPPSTRVPVYGLVKLDLEAAVRGPSTHPAVTMQVGVSDDSNVTYIIPPSEAGIIEQRGIVVFVDKDAVNDPFLKEVKPTEGPAEGFTGVELSATIALRDRETLNIVIDPETGDKLTVRGNANLTFNIDPSGNMNLSGRYEITEGLYNLSFYKLVKREFEITRGSVITWSGDPLRGALDIRALYTVEAAPVELVASQLRSSDESVLDPYRQRLPFLVYLNIGGELMVPEISFYLDMPDDKKNVHGGIIYARILDIDSKESELNKQVFGLLILRTFVAENPLEGSSGGDLENSARISASRMLSAQLNRLSSRIKGVELSLDVKSYEDYTSGQPQGRTQAQLGLSKTLFGDRLVVKLSGNVDIEGESQQSNVTDYIGDIALEYKVTNDGRIRLTGFRNSNYDMIDGELIETGAGVIFVKDYNALRELLRPNEQESN
jgi:translocation and assembly module TamB